MNMPKTIFVVDDSDTNLAMAEEALEEHYRVITFQTASKMFSFSKKIKPDLILLDIEMPEMDGFEALKILKSNDSLANIPVIFLTAHSNPDTKVLSFEHGVLDFIAKPFSASVLLDRIKAHVKID
jgi:putative two-component system response regulator